MKRRISLFDVINTMLLCIIGFVEVFPVWYVFVISVSTGTSYIADKLHFWPKVVDFSEYRRVLSSGDLIHSLGISMVVVMIGTFLALMVTLMAAYALSRKRLHGRKFFTTFFIMTMFFSAGIIPNYLLVTSLGLKNTIWALILPSLHNAYYLMIMRTYLGNTSVALEESAKLDGASDFTILFAIILPVSTPMIAAIGLFFGVQFYNDYFNSLLYITSRSLYPLQFLLREMVVNNIANSSGVGGSSTTTVDIFKMASVVLSLIPILCIYPFIARYFVQGLMLGSVKE